MQLASVEAIVRALNDAEVRYLIVGGLAVVAHGYVRFTADVDLVVQLEPENVRQALRALAALGYSPRNTVSAEQFADADLRQQWIDEKHLLVFSLFSPQHDRTIMNLFAREPFDFWIEYKEAFRQEIAPGIVAPFVRIETLLALKATAGRDIDLVDVKQLRRILESDAQ